MDSISKYAKTFMGVRQGSRRHKLIVDRYNQIRHLPRGYRVKYTDNWCATFVSFVLYSCGCTKNLYECSAERLRKKFIKAKLKVDNDKGVKDCIIWYDWDNNKWADHVGIIAAVDKKYYYVIEGNKNKRVEMRTIEKSSKAIFTIAKIS